MSTKNLLWLAASVTFLTVGTTAIFSCNSIHNCSCIPNANSPTYTLQCPPENNKVEIKKATEYYTVDCFGRDFIRYVPWIESGDKTDTITFNKCNLSQEVTATDVMTKLGLSNVKHFKISNNKIENISKHCFNGLQSLESLELVNNSLNNLPEDLLSEMKNLTYIRIYQNQLSLPSSLFKNTRNLKYVDFGQNGINAIPIPLFTNLSQLTNLNLWSNNLTSIDKDMFYGLKSLENLELLSNNISSVAADVFEYLTQLKVLGLRKNKFRSLPEGLFDNNSKLEDLNLSDNPELSLLPENFLANLSNLRVVRIAWCNLSSIPENIFWGDFSLKTLDLARNKLTTLPEKIFRDTSALEEINLSHNSLKNLDGNVFEDLPNLRVLRLNNNKLEINGFTFNGLKNLEELYLQFNELKTLGIRSFVHFQNLKILDMSNNQLTMMDVAYNTDAWSMLAHLKFLEELYLQNNNISDVFTDWRVNLFQLKILDLSHNKIEHLSHSDLDFHQKHEVTVNLKYNKITGVNMMFAEILAKQNAELDPKAYKQRKAIIFLQGNPIICDCNIYDLVRYFKRDLDMDKVQQTIEIIIPEDQTCSGPIDLIGQKITKLDFKTLTCILAREMQPKMNINCSKSDCRYRPYGQTIIIDCSNHELKKMPELVTVDYKRPTYRVNAIEFNLKGNNIKTVKNYGNGYEYVTKMDLSHNNIEKIEWLPENLSELNLHNNNLTSMSSEALTALNKTKISHLTLYDNPWECNCDVMNFSKYLKENFKSVDYLSNVTCKGTNIEIIDLNQEEMCPVSEGIVTAFIITVSFLVVIFCIMIALYYRFQQEIKVWLYAHNMCLWFVTEEELDKDKLYDAFISYSHKDEDFVVNELLPKLESGPNPFKLCLHFRNWLPGEFITANIARSVEESRRTLVVLSPSFLESEWGKMEFRTAHIQALSEGRARVIVILYGDIGNIDQLDTELKAYLTTNTYMQWGDPWFWDKLKYALPHPPIIKKNNSIPQSINIDDKQDLINGPVTPPISSTPPADTFHSDPLKAKNMPPTALNVSLINGALINNADLKLKDSTADIRSIV